MEYPVNPSNLLKKPTGFLPFALSGAALCTIVVHILMVGIAPQADEGTAAHLWQLFMALQLPVVGFFALTWVPRAPRAAITVFLLQLLALAAAAAPVFMLGW